MEDSLKVITIRLNELRKDIRKLTKELESLEDVNEIREKTKQLYSLTVRKNECHGIYYRLKQASKNEKS